MTEMSASVTNGPVRQLFTDPERPGGFRGADDDPLNAVYLVRRRPCRRPWPPQLRPSSPTGMLRALAC